jgi:trimethylamine--corrinoid protein Co-methyltransferase
LAAERKKTGKRGGRRQGGRSANRRRNVTGLDQLAWDLPLIPDSPTEPLNEEGLNAIHDGAMQVLEEIGIEFIHEDAKRILAENGCIGSPDSDNVRIGRDFVMEQVKKAPSEFQITPRNPARQVHVGGGHMVFGNVGSPPNCSDLDSGRRPGDRSAYQDLIKLSQYFNCSREGDRSHRSDSGRRFYPWADD